MAPWTQNSLTFIPKALSYGHLGVHCFRLLLRNH